MKSTLWMLLTGLVLLCLLLTPPIAGQTTFGSITGTVTDQTGAVIPGAAVTVINEGTGAERRMQTTETGVFNAPNLNVGSYRVRIGVSIRPYAPEVRRTPRRG